MARVSFARHLFRFFPSLEGKEVVIEARTVRELLAGLEALAPGFSFYVADEQGSLRQHVNIWVDDELIADRRALSDGLQPGSRVFILQALSGG
jgi:hypothetical protein